MKRLTLESISNHQNSIDTSESLKTSQVGIVHIGFGAFHKPYQAFMTNGFINEKYGVRESVSRLVSYTHV